MREDKELIDALEAAIKREALTLWNGEGEFPACGKTAGLSLLGGARTLRQALESALPKSERKDGAA